MANNNGYVIASLTPGWIKKRVPDNYADDVLKDLIMFYVINTPCDDLSSSGIKLTEYGWGKDVWKNDRLKNYLFSIAGLERNSSFAVASKTDEMKLSVRRHHLKKIFIKTEAKNELLSIRGVIMNF